MILVTKKGKIIRFNALEIPISRIYSPKGNRYYPAGIKIPKLDDGDHVIALFPEQ